MSDVDCATIWTQPILDTGRQQIKWHPVDRAWYETHCLGVHEGHGVYLNKHENEYPKLYFCENE